MALVIRCSGRACLVNTPRDSGGRLLGLREMSQEDIPQGESGSTIDSIQMAAFESHNAVKEWLSESAPAFVR